MALLNFWPFADTKKPSLIQEEALAPSPMPEEAKPASGGRSSQPSTSTMLSLLIEEAAVVNPDYPIELIKVMRRLAMYHDDFSYATENIVLLGNTEHEVLFDDKVPPEQAALMRAELKQMLKRWHVGGGHGLINNMLTQLVITGALSAEAVPASDLKSLLKIVMVDTDTIQFVYDGKLEDYVPYQNPRISANNARKTNSAGLIKLNPVTYKYFPLRQYSEAPYGVPPFLSALESIKISNDMICGLKKIIEKLGIFGFLQALVVAPKQEPNEAFDVYQGRLKNYLDKWVTPEIEKALKNGFVTGYKNTHEFEMHDTITNVTGIKDLVEMNTIRVHAGLKQDPMMLGRPYTTTETLGRVILSKLAKQVTNYQKIIAAFLEQSYRMHLMLRGYKFEFLDVVFESPIVSDEVKEQQAYNIKINNTNILYDRGIIDQQTAANILGFEKPAEKEPREITPTDGQKTSGSDNPNNKKNPDPVKEKNWKELAASLGLDVEDYDYGLGEPEGVAE